MVFIFSIIVKGGTLTQKQAFHGKTRWKSCFWSVLSCNLGGGSKLETINCIVFVFQLFSETLKLSKKTKAKTNSNSICWRKSQETMKIFKENKEIEQLINCFQLWASAQVARKKASKTRCSLSFTMKSLFLSKGPPFGNVKNKNRKWTAPFFICLIIWRESQETIQMIKTKKKTKQNGAAVFVLPFCFYLFIWRESQETIIIIEKYKKI